MSPADAIALYRRERALSERRNRKARMIERAVLHHKYEQLLARTVPFQHHRMSRAKCRQDTPAAGACTSRRRKWNANGQLIGRD